MKKLVSALLALVLCLGVCGVFAESALPAYVYPFPEDNPLMAAIANWLVTEDLGFAPEEGGVLIPAPVILKEEFNEDETEATIYGNFWVFAYILKDRVLECTSGGENPGVMKLKKEGDVWTVSSMQTAEDGASFESSLAQLAGDDKDLLNAFIESGNGGDALDQIRRAFIVEYVNVCDLDVSTYMDYGQDPVSVVN